MILEIKLTLALGPHLSEKWKVQSQVKLSLLGGRGNLLPSSGCMGRWGVTETSGGTGER